MEPMLAAILTTIAVLTTAGVLVHARAVRDQQRSRHRRMALDRGLSHTQVLQLEHLADGLTNATVSDLVLSPARYNAAVRRYLESLTTTDLTTPQYHRVIHQLTRLRRRIHPPSLVAKPIQTSRELPEGVDVAVRRRDSPAAYRGNIWGVDEDHFAVQLPVCPAPRTFVPGTPVTVRITRPNATILEIRTVVRRIESGRRTVVHLEHARCRSQRRTGPANRRLGTRTRRALPGSQWARPVALRAVPDLRSA